MHGQDTQTATPVHLSVGGRPVGASSRSISVITSTLPDLQHVPLGLLSDTRDALRAARPDPESPKLSAFGSLI